MRWHNKSIIDKPAFSEPTCLGVAPKGSKTEGERNFEPTKVGGIIVARAVRPSFSTKIRPEPASAGGIMRGQEEYLGNANNR